MKLIDEDAHALRYDGAGAISLPHGLYGQMVDETDGRCVL